MAVKAGLTSGWKCRHQVLAVRERAHVMGVLNVTPDSFFDGGQFADPAAAISRGIQMSLEGADIIDVGGESTRPGADPVSLDQEIDRVIPVIEGIAAEIDTPISVDTTKSKVAGAAIESGAVIVNDVSAMRFDPAMPAVVRDSGAGVVLMHMLGEPRTMQSRPEYSDVVGEVGEGLLAWAKAAEGAGIAADSIVIDPGIGFGKTLEHNLRLIKSVGALGAYGYPVLLGPSRKSFIGFALDVPAEQRLEGTAAVVAWAIAAGTHIVRVHDVREMVRVVRMTEAIKNVADE